ncbi:MAG: zinc ABC transporter substrate-binding protein [Thermoleophilia bacterium]|nr:zinc ABC transporter substrate-binding protein [Thermoleophilia bacterium]
MLSRIILFSGVCAVLTAASVPLAGCGSTTTAVSANESVVTAFYPIAYAVEQIAGQSVDVRNLTPAGVEPHDLELTPGDVRDVDGAALVLYLGEGFMPGLETAVEQRGGRSVDLLADQVLSPGRDEDGAKARDPHVWLDPVRYAAMVRAIGVALHKRAGAERLAGRAERLDAVFRQRLASCARRQIVTSHAAFGYLAARYGLEQVPLEGLSPEAEPSARDIAGLAGLVETTGATTVFFETLVSPKLAQTVAREAGVETAVLNPLEGLTGGEVAAGADYFSVMRANLAALGKALGCRS